eukprot:scaffold100641_cov31-Tisochrysis_lutea.AAC.6
MLPGRILLRSRVCRGPAPELGTSGLTKRCGHVGKYGGVVGKESCGRAMLEQSARAQHKQSVAVGDSEQPVRDGKKRTRFKLVAQHRLHRVIRAFVKVGSSFVENTYGRV